MTEDFCPNTPDMFGEVPRQAHTSILGDRFLLPPFSVLNAREGWWQDRKRSWLALGIKSELGRGGGCNDMSPQLRAMKPSAMMEQPEETRLGGGLTWGNSPEITEKGLNFYRNKERRRLTHGTASQHGKGISGND